MIILATVVPALLLLPGGGPLDDGAGERVEAGSSLDDDNEVTPAADESADPAEDRSLKPFAQTAAASKPLLPEPAGPGDGETQAGEGELDGADSADPDGTAVTVAGSAEASAGEAEGSDGSTSTTEPQPAETTTTAPLTTAPPATAAPVSSNAPGANLRELYVDGSTGSMSNPGTEDRPFLRPIDATSIAEPGTTIYIRGGTYDTSRHGAFSIRRSGTAQNWIRITPYPGERVELVAGGEWGSGFEFLGASHVEISGFVIRGRDDSIHGTGVFLKDGAHDIRVIGNQISNFGGGGISVIDASKVMIEGNDVRNNAFRSHYQGSGISIFKPTGPIASGNAYTNVIRGNYVVNNYNAVPHAGDGRLTDGNCIILDRTDEVGYQGRTLIENNVCAENGGRGIHSYRSSNIVARNNTLYHNMRTAEIAAGRGELTAGEARNIVFYNNLVVNRPGIASFINNDTQDTYFHNNHVAAGPPPGEGNVLLPEGVSYFRSTDRGGSVDQFRPTSASGLAGSANSSRQSSHDLTGRTRPNPGAVGALEP